MTKPRWFLPLLLVTLLSASVSAFGEEQLTTEAPRPPVSPRLFAGVGLLSYDLGGYSNQPSGSTQFFSPFFTELTGMVRLPIASGPFGWSGLLGFTPLGRKSSDGGFTTRFLRAEWRIGGEYEKGEWKGDVSTGIGLLSWLIIGHGGTVSLSNGNTTTEFGLPSGVSAPQLFYNSLCAGVQYGRLRWDSSLIVTGLLSSRRAFSIATQIGFGFL